MDYYYIEDHDKDFFVKRACAYYKRRLKMSSIKYPVKTEDNRKGRKIKKLKRIQEMKNLSNSINYYNKLLKMTIEELVVEITKEYPWEIELSSHEPAFCYVIEKTKAEYWGDGNLKQLRSFEYYQKYYNI